MPYDFENVFAQFLEDRLGNALLTLQETNEEYRKLSAEQTALLNGTYQKTTEYRHSLSALANVIDKLGDIEKRYLFLAGMREHARMEHALTSKEFEDMFIH